MKYGLLLLLAAPTLLSAQNQPGDVVKRLFDAMRMQDTAAMRATMHPDMRLLAQGTNPQGVYRVAAVPVERWLTGIRNAPAATDERLFDLEQWVDGLMAAVWTRYEFWLGDRYSHCGYDAFQLIQLNGEWKIIAGADTQKRDPAAWCKGATVTVPMLSAADTAAVLAPIQKLFDAMRGRDTTAARSVFVEPARLLPHGATPRHMTVSDFVAQLARPGGQELRERLLKPTIVRIDDNLASVWSFYDFYLGDQFSHCGIDYAQLVKTPDGWKIAQLSWTMQRDRAVCDRGGK